MNRHLHTLLDEIIRDSRWDMTYLGMQIMVEGLALAAFGLMRFTAADEPLIQQITTCVMATRRATSRSACCRCEDLYTKEMTAAELQGARGLRDRGDDAHARPPPHGGGLGAPRLDAKIWVAWSLHTPFMVGFRQMLFSKIVPNLKRLGLLTPRVRKTFAKLDVLQFESLPDSTVDSETAMPPALMSFFMRLQAAGIELPHPGRERLIGAALSAAARSARARPRRPRSGAGTVR